MFQSTIVDVVIGLIFTFCAVSLAVSALTEALATALKWRAKNLLDGVADLLNDPQVTGLALDIYNHGLVNPQSSGTAKSKAGIEVKPSYIDPRQFASAFVEVAGIASNASTTTAAQVNGAIAGIANPQLQKALQGMADRAGGDLNKLRTEISQWFDDAMDRVSGIYKRRIQVWSFVIALLLCIILNIDSLRIAKTLWEEPAVAAGIATGIKASQALDSQTIVTQLESRGLPIGWAKGWDTSGGARQADMGDCRGARRLADLRDSDDLWRALLVRHAAEGHAAGRHRATAPGEARRADLERRRDNGIPDLRKMPHPAHWAGP